ncbi:hypothetical protein NC651_018434 [Populus alba x Populus x berolinensis]|nr:hypothetical protein NC651_018434 [Populus alba x Populus x berolinensis]
MMDLVKIHPRKIWYHRSKLPVVHQPDTVVQHQEIIACKSKMLIFSTTFFFFVCLYRKCKNGVNKNKTEEEHRVAFRTKSDLEIMDDGYKWRKYGKKSVKNSPNPRTLVIVYFAICTWDSPATAHTLTVTTAVERPEMVAEERATGHHSRESHKKQPMVLCTRVLAS